MKLAIVSPGALPVPAIKGGAVEVLITDLILGNAELGTYDIDLYTIRDESLNDVHIANANIIQLGYSPFMHLMHRVRNIIFHRILGLEYKAEYKELLCKELQKHDYDYVLIENQFHLLHSIYGRTKHKNNLLIHLHNNLDDSRTPKDAAAASKIALGVVVISDYLKKLYSTCMDESKIYVLPNCVSENFTNHDAAASRSKYREKYGISKKDFVFFFSGRIEPYKGIAELMQAFGRLSEKYPNVKLAIVGKDFRSQSSYDRFIRKLKDLSVPIADKLIFTDYVLPSEMPSVLSMADTVVIPSTWEEPFGVVALETMTEGIPAICTDSGALPDIMTDGSALIVNKEGDLVAELASAMERLLNDGKLREKMISSQKDIMENHTEYRQSQYFSNFVEIIDKIISQNKEKAG